MTEEDLHFGLTDEEFKEGLMTAAIMSGLSFATIFIGIIVKKYVSNKIKQVDERNVKDDTIALICFGLMIIILDAWAIAHGINGQYMIWTFGCLTGLFGVYIGRKTKR